MNAAARGAFWVTNHIANPVVRPLLRSRFGRRLGRHLAVVHYRGRRTGNEHELVAQYVRNGNQVLIVPGQPQRKTWWRNFREPADIQLRLAGEDSRGRAFAVEGHDRPDDVAEDLRTYLARLPKVARTLGVKQPGDVATIAAGAVVVRVDLDPHT